MSKVDSLVKIKQLWAAPDLSLYDKATAISEEYYSANLDLSGTAEFIGATPSELDSLLSLSELDDDMLRQVSDTNPPITTWMILANASEEEFQAALEEIGAGRNGTDAAESIGERVYSAMIQVAGPTTEQALTNLAPDVIYAMAKRAEEFKSLPPRELKALKSFGAQRKRGKVLSEKQVSWMKSMFERMSESKAIVRGGIDSDQDKCDTVLDALEL